MQRYNLSFWERETFFRDIDIAIIGSGIVGLSAALHIKALQPHLKVAIIERGTLPAGASTRNAGFACFGSMTELLDDMTRMSDDAVWAVVEKRWRGLQRLRATVGDAYMNYQPSGGYELFTDDDEEVYEQCLAHRADMNATLRRITGHPEVYTLTDPQLQAFGFRGVRHLIFNEAEGQVHTGKMMERLLALARERGIVLFNGITIQRLEDSTQGVELETSEGWTLRVPKVLIAVNGFAKRLLPDIEVNPARNQVLITQPIPGLALKGCFHYDRGYYYFRNVGNRILLGGGRNLDQQVEQTDEFGENTLIRSALMQLLRTVVYPHAPLEVDIWWTGILGLGPVKKPIVERYSSNVVLAVRLSGMGVAIGSLVGQEGADMLLGN